MYSTGPAFARLLHDLGTDEQKQWAQVWAQKRWGATMVLTEPDAGSDVGAGRTSATQQSDGSWHISGVKRFITSGEHDMTENIVHLVLALLEGAGPGTKGLSLFIVPKYHVDWATGELRERNGVYATNVEHKMGLKASATCELTFGEREPAVGWLVGDVHDGIAQMFKVIEYARMLVGSKAIATLSAGYLSALEYTKTRVQGPDLTRASDKTAPRVTVINHPDVRRSLMTQKAYSEGLRALMLYAASVQDAVEVKEASVEDASLDHALNDLLLPVVKGYGSEKSYGLLAESLQCFSVAPAIRRTTPSSSTSETPRSTRSTRARPRSRGSICSFARWSRTTSVRSPPLVKRSGRWLLVAATSSPANGSCSGQRCKTCRQ